MAKNKKNQASASKAVANRGSKVGGDRASRVAIICFAVLAIVGLTVGGVGFIISEINNRPVDYRKDDLSQYVYISESDYKGFDVVIKVDPVTDMDVENAVLKALYKARSSTPEYDGKYLPNETVTAGDKVFIYYRGYTLGEDGEKVDFSGGCNFSSEEAGSLEIGSGSFITGFELGLVGKNARDYSKLTKRTSGVVGKGSFVMLTYTAAYPDGSTALETSKYVSLEDNACDKIFGTGFADFLADKEVGVEIEEDFIGTNIPDLNGDPVFTDMKVTSVYEVGDNPLTVEAFFPYDYSEESLRSTTAYFDVYIQNVQVYKAPELNNEFITSTLKIDSASLEEYEGATLVDRWKSSIRAELEAEYQENVDLQIGEAILKHYSEKVQVKKLPKSEVNSYYNDYVAQWENEYSMYGSDYASLDEYVITNMNLNYYDDWREVIMKEAEKAITDKLVFYYVLSREGIYPSEEDVSKEKDALIEDYLAEYLEQMGVTRDKYDSDEKYETAINAYRDNLLSYYSDSYFEENAVYVLAMKTLRTYVNPVTE